MAPTPSNSRVASNIITLTKRSQYWTKPTIAITAVFAALALGIVLLAVAFLLHRRSKKQQIAKSQADRAALLEKEDKASMFSGHRASESTFRFNPEAGESNSRTSQDITQHTPLFSTPAEDISNPMSNPTYYTPATTATHSNGSGVSALSRTTDSSSPRIVFSPVSPASEGSDLGITVTTTRPRSSSATGRPRRVSAASQKRYYDVTPASVELPPIPKIVHTASD